MRLHTIAALALLLLLAAPAFALAAPVAPAASPVAPATPSGPASPALDAFLASLAPAGAALPAAACGPNFCTQTQRDACDQQCRSHGHVIFVGLECCQNCTTLCICGSRPVNC